MELLPDTCKVVIPFSHFLDIVASICHTLDIPHLTFDWSPSEALDEKPLKSMSINLYPYNVLFSRGLAETVQSFGWRSFTIVYETEKGMIYQLAFELRTSLGKNSVLVSSTNSRLSYKNNLMVFFLRITTSSGYFANW